MATIQKLYISGVRSFSPHEDDVQIIQFGSPLTLFLGQNGCGKTTIIEALRYACTGELPGGTNQGHGFVNDPKLTSGTYTRAQIRLKLRDARGNEVTIFRIMEVTQKLNNMQFSSKPPTIKVRDASGKVESMGNSCAEINRICSEYLNVSPSILSNVIFCHQENSSWPLDEGKKLKEKFDDIFDAQRYNKCLDLFKRELKLRSDNLKRINIQLECKLEAKKRVEDCQSKLQIKIEKMQQLETNITNKEVNLLPLNEELVRICQLENVLMDLQKALATKLETKNGYKAQYDTLRDSIKYVFEGTDEELMRKINEFDNERKTKEDIIRNLQERKEAIEGKSKIIGSALQNLQAQSGKLTEEKRQYEKKCEEQSVLIEKIKRQLNIQEASMSLDSKFEINTIKNCLKQSQDELNALDEEIIAEENSIQANIDVCRETILKITNQCGNKNEEIDKLQQIVRQNESEIQNISKSDFLLKHVSTKISEIDKTISNLCTKVQENNIEASIEEKRNNIQCLEMMLQQLEREYKSLQANSAIEERLDNEKTTVLECDQQISMIKNTHQTDLSVLFKGKIPDSPLLDQVTTIKNNETVKILTISDQINQKQMEINTLEATFANNKQNILNCKENLEQQQQQIDALCAGKDYETVLSASREQLEELQRDQGQYNSGKIIFSTFVKEFEKDAPCCPVCQTNFTKSSLQIPSIIHTLKTKIDKIPQNLEAITKKLKNQEELYIQLQQLKPIFEERSRLEVQLPILKTEVQRLQNEFKMKEDDLTDLQSEIRMPHRIVDICTNIWSDIGEMDQCFKRKTSALITIKNLEEQLSTLKPKRSRQECEIDIETIKGDITTNRTQVDTLEKHFKKHNEQLLQLNKERQTYVEEQINYKVNATNKPKLESDNTNYLTKISNLKYEVQQITTTKNSLNVDLTKLLQSKNDSCARNKHIYDEKKVKLEICNTIINQIDWIQTDVDNYNAKDVPTLLQNTNTESDEILNKIQTLESTRNRVVEEIVNRREDLAKEDTHFNALQGNVSLRDIEKKSEEVNVDIDNLQEKIENYDYETVRKSKQTISRNVESMESEINEIIGQKKELGVSIQEIRDELDLPVNTNAFKDHLLKYYEFSVTKHVIEDLTNYIWALEKSILHFHKQRLVEINRIIRQYWRSVYRGNDIDFIEIRTEDPSGAKTKRRNYNYKVIQVKNGTELDMRGRCSAGQRVLACLIIRLALSEVLSTNCGILALDEPTTNLDKDNIHSLCTMLNDLVEMRSKNKNFQLLIITHDEEFINELTRNQCCSFYYNVSRNRNGFSVVTKESI